jgi:hypothetical protein
LSQIFHRRSGRTTNADDVGRRGVFKVEWPIFEALNSGVLPNPSTKLAITAILRIPSCVQKHAFYKANLRKPVFPHINPDNCKTCGVVQHRHSGGEALARMGARKIEVARADH